MIVNKKSLTPLGMIVLLLIGFISAGCEGDSGSDDSQDFDSGLCGLSVLVSPAVPGPCKIYLDGTLLGVVRPGETKVFYVTKRSHYLTSNGNGFKGNWIVDCTGDTKSIMVY